MVSQPGWRPHPNHHAQWFPLPFQHSVLGLCGKVSVTGWATGRLLKKLLEAFLSLTELMSDGSKTDPPLAKATSDTSDSGRAYGKIY